MMKRVFWAARFNESPDSTYNPLIKAKLKIIHYKIKDNTICLRFRDDKWYDSVSGIVKIDERVCLG